MEYTSVLEILSSSKISGRLSPFKPCVHCCRLCQMTAVATPLSPPFGDSGRQGREVVTFVEGQPHHTPRGPGTLPFPFGEGHRAHPHTTGRASLLCLSLYRISGGQSFHRRCPGESLALVLAVLDAHGNRRMFLPVAGICCRCRGLCFLFPRLTS